MLLKEVGYCRPATVEAATRVLEADENARPLAGGQSLINVMKLHVAAPSVLVDLNGIPDLRSIALDDDGAVRIGAMTIYDDLDRSETLRRSHPIISQVAAHLADRQVRNRGTIGGNVCYSDPTSNFPPLLVTLQATMIVVGPDHERETPAADFFRGAYEPNLQRGEILTAIRVPATRPGTGFGYQSLRVTREGWALVHAAAAIEMSDGVVAGARITLGCVSGTPVRARAMESALVGRVPSEEVVREAARQAGEGINPPSDAHASVAYRRQMAGVMARRAVMEAIAGARS